MLLGLATLIDHIMVTTTNSQGREHRPDPTHQTHSGPTVDYGEGLRLEQHGSQNTPR